MRRLLLIEIINRLSHWCYSIAHSTNLLQRQCQGQFFPECHCQRLEKKYNHRLLNCIQVCISVPSVFHIFKYIFKCKKKNIKGSQFFFFVPLMIYLVYVRMIFILFHESFVDRKLWSIVANASSCESIHIPVLDIL